MEGLEVASYFKKSQGLARYIRQLQEESVKPVVKRGKTQPPSNTKELRILDVLFTGLLVAQKFGCTNDDAIKRRRLTDVYITFLTPEINVWLPEADYDSPIIFWKYNDITFMLSEQKLKCLDSVAICMFGIIGPHDRIFPSIEALEDYNRKQREAYELSLAIARNKKRKKAV